MAKSIENNCDINREDHSIQISKAIHDLNNAIGPISGYADMIRNTNSKNNGEPVDLKLAKRIDKIRSCVEKAGEVIERLSELKATLEHTDTTK